MGKNSTLLKSSHKNHAVDKGAQVKASTINFLKQFARAYSYDKRLLGCNLGSFVAN